ncbi:MAG TPA: hypothetical protein VGS41_17700, partial [Chthonomonadales bacterium]|nr:hypothetical protein [Chthonomonadales bacterium]
MQFSFLTFRVFIRPLTLLALAVSLGWVLTPCARADVLLSSGADKKVKIWSPDLGPLKTFDNLPATVDAIAVSPDGKTVASG